MSKLSELEEKTHEFCREESEINREIRELQSKKNDNGRSFKKYLIDEGHIDLLEIKRGALGRITHTKY